MSVVIDPGLPLGRPGFFLWVEVDMPTRRLDDGARVMVFVDGQNLYKGCYENFGHPHCHPLLLARQLAGSRRLIGVRYYSGLHDPRVNPELNARVQRRHHLMRRTGVSVVERILRYRWEWGLQQRDLPRPEAHLGETLSVDVMPHQRAREKGIDVAIALDVVDLAARLEQMDVAIVVSSDTDLCEVPRVVHDVTGRSRRVSVEGAVLRGRRTVVLPHYDFTHQIDAATFGVARDGFDYREQLDASAVEQFLEDCRAGTRPGWSI